jgi:hypothetical protein
MRVVDFLMCVAMLAAGCGSSSSGPGTSGTGGASSSTGGEASTSSGSGTSGASGTISGASASGGNTAMSTTGATSGGATSGGTSGPSCNKSLPENDGASCATDADCGCDDSCVSDPPLGMTCEPSCAQLSDCVDLGYLCNGAYCQFNECGPGTGNGDYNSFCNVVGTDDGTCIPIMVGGVEVGQCRQGGASMTCCSANASRTNTSAQMTSVCVAGSICSGGQNGQCGPVCDPNQGGGCAPSTFCAVELGDNLTGGCFGSASLCPSNN